jgi:hypothetical protein
MSMEPQPLSVKSQTGSFVRRWGQSPFSGPLDHIAEALDKASTPQEKKQILDQTFGTAIEQLLEVANTVSRLVVFLCLAHKTEGLFWIDLAGMEKDFDTENDAFEWWAREYLHQVLPGKRYASVRSKVIHYVRINYDLELIDRLTFEKAWIFSKYKYQLSNLDNPLSEAEEEALLVWAENKELKADELTTTLDWEADRIDRIQQYLEENNRKPPPEVLVNEWKKEHLRKREEKSLSYKKAKGKPPGDPLYISLHKQLGGMTKGEVGTLSMVFRTILEDILPRKYDVGDGIYKFLHRPGRYPHCLISNVEFTRDNPMEVHHLHGKGRAGGDRRFFNLIPISRQVHTEIEKTLGLEKTLSKYAVTEEFILTQAIRVLVEYVMHLEGQIND